MSGRAAKQSHSPASLVVIVVALLVAVYLAFQVIGVLIRLALLVAAALIALAAYRAWRAS